MIAVEPIDRIVDLIQDKYPEWDAESVRNILLKHIEYNTFDCLWSGGRPIACVRYNISESGKTAHILDLVIKDGYNGLRIMKWFILNGWRKFPSAEFIIFRRSEKDNRLRMYKIKDLLKGS